MDDLRKVVHDTEALLRATEGQIGEKADEARRRVQAALETARTRPKPMQGSAAEDEDAVRSTEAYVRDNPWQAIGIAAGVAAAAPHALGARTEPAGGGERLPIVGFPSDPAAQRTRANAATSQATPLCVRSATCKRYKHRRQRCRRRSRTRYAGTRPSGPSISLAPIRTRECRMRGVFCFAA